MDEGRPGIPESLQEPFRSTLVSAVDARIGREGLVSIVLFGFVARREARPTSDIDVLLLVENLPSRPADRRQPFLEALGSSAYSAWSGTRRMESERQDP